MDFLAYFKCKQEVKIRYLPSGYVTSVQYLRFSSDLTKPPSIFIWNMFHKIGKLSDRTRSINWNQYARGYLKIKLIVQGVTL